MVVVYSFQPGIGIFVRLPEITHLPIFNYPKSTLVTIPQRIEGMTYDNVKIVFQVC